jgi:hypothetical protein
MKNYSKIFTLISIQVLLVFTACHNKPGYAQTNTSAKKSTASIHEAAASGNAEAITHHIKAGADLNEKDPYGGSSPLISAALFGYTEVVSLLLDAGADINFQNNDGSTALHTASFFCRTEIVKLLLQHGADKSIQNKYGSTAYQSVAGPFANVKPVYDIMGSMLKPMGLRLDYAYLESTRPVIANLLK